MSSGVVNPLATGINSTCKVGGGGGGIRFDVPPPQPANATVAIPDKIALHRRLLNGKSGMVPPGWHFHSARPPPGTSSHSQPFRVNTLQNLANLRPFLQRKARLTVLWQNRGLQARIYGPQKHSRSRTPHKKRKARQEIHRRE